MDDGHVAGWPSLENWAGWLTSLFSLLIPNYLDTSRQPTAGSTSTREREGKGHQGDKPIYGIDIPFLLRSKAVPSGWLTRCIASLPIRPKVHPANNPSGRVPMRPAGRVLPTTTANENPSWRNSRAALAEGKIPVILFMHGIA